MVLVRSKDLSCARPLADVPDKWEAAEGAEYSPNSTQKIPALGALLGDNRPTDPRQPAIDPVSQPNVVGSYSASPAPGETTTLNNPPSSDDNQNGSLYTNVFPSVSGETVADDLPVIGGDDVSSSRDPGSGRSYTQADPFPRRETSGRGRLAALLLVPVMLCFVLGVAGAFVVVFQPEFARGWNLPTVAGTPAPSPTPVRPTGTARTDFKLRAEPNTQSAESVAIANGTTIVLIDSAGGETLDGSLPEPSKWYRVRTTDGLAEGWAYSGWISR